MSERPTSVPVGSIKSNGSIRSTSRSLEESGENGLLKPVTEASESSKPALTPGPNGQAILQTDAQDPGWWFWKSSATAEAKPVQVTDVHPSISEPETDSWNNVFTSYKNNVVGYFYYPDSNTNGASESTPLLPSQNNKPDPQSSWTSWIWGSPNIPDEEQYSEYTNNVELYKSAKLAIENPKDFCSYAYKGSKNSQFLINDHELAVFNTPTQDQPVKYNIKKTPIIPAEVQENTLQVVVSSVNPSPARTPPVVTSSNSSVHENNEINLPRVKADKITPQVEENFRTITLITKLRLLGEKLLFQHNTSENHLYKDSFNAINNRKIKKIKKVVVIGVHGFLPTKFVKSMIGLPTGNSIKLIEEATKGLEQWLDDVQEPGFENMYNIETIALEGQGTVTERVEKSMKLLENWTELINDSDFIYVIGHSQGAIIAINLLAKMLTESSLFKLNKKKIGLLNMAGPIHGPIKNLDTKIVTRAYSIPENEVLSEFLQLLNPNSDPSRLLQQNFDTLTNKNVKITLSGSINDQIIPLESSLANAYYHPNIYRCIHVDKDCQLPPFIVTLWKLILVSRNVGHVEHGLIKEFSGRCLGTLTDGGHGKIFEDSDIYSTSIKFSLESTSLTQSRPLHVNFTNEERMSLYTIPWSVRELMEDILQTKHIPSHQLVHDLVKTYNGWEPILRPWKELKYSLDALSDIDLDDLIV